DAVVPPGQQVAVALELGGRLRRRAGRQRRGRGRGVGDGLVLGLVGARRVLAPEQVADVVDVNLHPGGAGHVVGVLVEHRAGVDYALRPGFRLPHEVLAATGGADDAIFAGPVADAGVPVDADAITAEDLAGGPEVVDGDAVPLLEGDVEV